MSTILAIVASSTVLGSPAGTGETAIVTTPVLGVALQGATVLLWWSVTERG